MQGRSSVIRCNRLKGGEEVNVTIQCTDELEGIKCTRPKNPVLRSRALETRSVHWKSYTSALEMCLTCTGKSHLVHWKVDSYSKVTRHNYKCRFYVCEFAGGA